MQFVIQRISHDKSDIFSDLIKFNDIFYFVFAIIRLNEHAFLIFKKIKILQMMTNGLSYFLFLFRYVKKNNPPLFVPFLSFFNLYFINLISQSFSFAVLG